MKKFLPPQTLVSVIFFLVCLLFTPKAWAGDRQRLHGHVPEAVARLSATGRSEPTQRLHLSIGLPLRNQADLTQLLQELYDPSSPNYRHFLTPQQFAEKFGPTEQDYQALSDFAKANGLTVTATHPNRVVMGVEGSVRQIEKAFQVNLRTYQHPTEKRIFYAPDAEPSMDLAVPVQHVSGLDNYSLPHPNHKLVEMKTNGVVPQSGSGPSGTYAGNDFRAAYVPGTTLTGSGQSIGLLQFDSYYASDITAYETQFGLPNVTLINVAVDGGVAVTGSNNVEVCLDIEMAIAMAPGISSIYVYEAPNVGSYFVDLLNRMANDNTCKQLSCSWSLSGAGPNATAEAIFQQMAAQGQSFFNATGDVDAFTGSIPFPSDSPNITQVGATTLTTSGAGGSYVSETVWNRGSGVGSSGGSSTYYSLPTWQQGISMSTNQGSTSKRNLPDVALVGESIYVRYSNGLQGGIGGTSCAAPLWAGLTALINQRAMANGQSPVGFLNPALYVLGKGSNYASNFYDTTTGNNFSPSSPSKFSAATGYDLCTGWGTPKAALVNTLSGAPILTGSLSATGTNGLAFSYQIVASNSPTSYSATGLPDGLTVNTATGLISGTPTVLGVFNATIYATNSVGTGSATLAITVLVAPPVITNTLSASGTVGTPFSFQITATNNPTSYGASGLPSGLSVNTSTGLISGTPMLGGTSSVTITATNDGGTGSATLTITIPLPPVIISPITTLCSFNGTNGRYPCAGLIQGSDGNFYGTTYSGGSSSRGNVFKVTPGGTLTSLYSFTTSNGRYPYAGLIQGSDGNLYGTTYSSSSTGRGTVFKLTTGGALTWLYSFNSTNGNGTYLYAGVVQAGDGNLYGSTYSGGSSGYGTLFKVTTGGTLTLLDAFDSTHGANSTAGLIQGNDGDLYGTTYAGGSSNLGTVFKITTSGSLTTLYSFDSTHGANPYAGLTQGSDGALYGTTCAGGSSNLGTVFKITTSGSLSSLYSFDSTHGADPYAGLVQGVDGNFYGTTYIGGNNNYGTVFDITSSGSLNILYSFANGSDGGNPRGGVVLGSDGNFYGTTYSGGSSAYGTVFKIAPFYYTVAEGNAFSYQITALNNPTSYNATGLPSGITVNTTTGVISGSPAASGTFNVTISATSLYGTGSAILTLNVPPSPPVITSTTSAAATLGQVFSYQIIATNNPASYNATGLPGGLNINTATGLISGTPTVTGSFNVSLSATNSSGTGSATLAITILPQPPLTVTNAASLITGSSAILNGSVNANGGNTVVSFDYGLTSGYGSNIGAAQSPVNGSMAIPVSAVLSGLTPGATYHYRVVGVNAGGTSTGTDGTFTTLNNNAKLSGLTISAGVLSPVFTSATTSYTASVVNATTTLTVTPTVSDSNATVTVNGVATQSGAASGAISLNEGSNTITTVVTAQDSTTTQTYTIVVTRLLLPVITSALSLTGTNGSGLSYQITATNSPTSYGASGLPSGLSVDPSTGSISGTPTATGTTNVTLSATNAGGTGSATLKIVVLPPPPVITSALLATGTVGTAYTQSLAASGGTLPYTWSVASGSLPAGLSLSSGGVISGTPSVESTANFTVQVTGGDGAFSAKAFGLNITPAATGVPVMPPWGFALMSSAVLFVATRFLKKCPCSAIPRAPSPKRDQ